MRVQFLKHRSRKLLKPERGIKNNKRAATGKALVVGMMLSLVVAQEESNGFDCEIKPTKLCLLVYELQNWNDIPIAYSTILDTNL